MALRIQLRRGTTTEHSSFTGAMGEVTVDTSKNTLVVHDGVTVGGFPLISSGGGGGGGGVIGGTYKTISRTRGVTYTNTSGKTIVICVIVSNTSMSIATGVSGIVHGIVVANTTGVEGGHVSFSMVVPNNATYSYSYYTGTGVTATVLELS